MTHSVALYYLHTYIPETRVFGKSLIMMQHQVFEVVAHSHRSWSGDEIISCTSGE